MSERYVKIFASENDLYADQAPILIRASALLKDTETGKMIAQVKMRNVSGKTITYVKVSITQLDAMKNPITDAVAFEYLDLSVADGEEFGAKKALPLPSASCRSFRIGVSQIAFSDGSNFACDNVDWKPALTETKKIVGEQIYQQAAALLASEEIANVKEAKKLFESITGTKDVASEIASCEKVILQFEEKIAKEEEKIAKEKEEKKRKRKKRLPIIILICFLVCAVGFFGGYPLVSCLAGNYGSYINLYQVKEFTIPNGVTSIESDAFGYCSSLTSVTIPGSVERIEANAFALCSNLTSVTFSDGLKSIGIYAFDWTSLTSVTIPGSVERIDDGAFSYCSNLTSVTFSDGLKSIGSYAFFVCTSLTSITIPNSVTSIDHCAFACCENLSSITFDGTVDEWIAVEKGHDWASDTSARKVICTDGSVWV